MNALQTLYQVCLEQHQARVETEIRQFRAAGTDCDWQHYRSTRLADFRKDLVRRCPELEAVAA